MTLLPRIFASAFASLVIVPAIAADLTAPAEAPEAPPIFFVHAGAFGEFPVTNAQPTGGGAFANISNVAIRPVYSLALEAGYFVTPNIAIALSEGVAPIAHLKATGFTQEALFGTNLLGSVREGSIRLLLQYHFTQFGAFQPYVGAGGSYFVNLGNISDGILQNFYVDQNFAFLVQAGADYMFTKNWGVFIDGKKAFFSTDAGGTVFLPFVGSVPVRSHIELDPWVASAGVTFKY